MFFIAELFLWINILSKILIRKDNYYNNSKSDDGTYEYGRDRVHYYRPINEKVIPILSIITMLTAILIVVLP
jgi:hypothetical protein